jgi:hypothetical protein
MALEACYRIPGFALCATVWGGSDEGLGSWVCGVHFIYRRYSVVSRRYQESSGSGERREDRNPDLRGLPWC